MQKNYQSFSNPALLEEYAAIQEAITKSVNSKGRAPKWMLVESSLCGAEILKRMNDNVGGVSDV